MFEFFLALFGGAYYGGRFFFERASSRAFDTWNERSVALDNKIKASIQKTIRVEELLTNRRSRMSVLYSIFPELTEIYGDEWMELFYKAEAKDIEMGYMRTPMCIAFNILLSKEGYTPNYGWRNCRLWGDDDVRSKTIKAYWIIEKNIRKMHGDEFEIVFVPDIETYKPLKYYECMYGKMMWKHNVVLDGRNKPIKRLW